MADFTVGELREQLAFLPDDTKLSFEGGLTFGRVKRSSEDEFILCFGELQAEQSPIFRKLHPSILVVFARMPADEEGVSVVSIPRL